MFANLKKLFSIPLPILGTAMVDSTATDSALQDSSQIAKFLHNDLLMANASDTEGLRATFRDIHTIFTQIITWEGFTIERFIIAILGILVGVFLYYLIKTVIAKGFHTIVDHIADVDTAKLFSITLAPGIACIAGLLPIYVGLRPILAPAGKEALLKYWQIFIAVEVIIFAITAYKLTTVISKLLRQKAMVAENTAREVFLVIFSTVLKIIIVCATILYVGDRLGFDITALLAGAGVIGLAIAFAAQDTVANVFGSVMIAFDQPFKKGDFVKMDGVEGTIEQIGFRSTRIRNPEGHLITVPNKNCANAVIINVTERPFMRLNLELGLIYQTTPAQMARAIEILREIVTTSPGQQTDFPPRIGFNSFDAYAITIKMSCWYFNLDENGKRLPIDIWNFGKWNSDLNMKILERFNAEGLEFAYPTHVSYFSALNPDASIKVSQS